MQSIKEIASGEVLSPYRGSEKTKEMVREQVRERWGDECADNFDPRVDAMPAVSWASYGFRIQKGEKALKSVTFLEVKDSRGKVTRTIRRVVNLFHRCQVIRVS